MNASVVPLIGRFLLGAIFLMSGVNKLLGPAGAQAYIAKAGLPAPMLAYWVAVAVEIIGPILLIIGFKARWAALVLAAFTLATALGFHTNFADQNQMIHFMKNLALAGGLLMVFAYGPGSISVDAKTR